MYYLVYKITNKLNSKSYIGAHRTTPEQRTRWAENRETTKKERDPITYMRQKQELAKIAQDKRWINTTPEQRSEQARNRMLKRTVEDRSRSAKLAWETKRKNLRNIPWNNHIS